MTHISRYRDPLPGGNVTYTRDQDLAKEHAAARTICRLAQESGHPNWRQEAAEVLAMLKLLPTDGGDDPCPEVPQSI